MHKHDPEAVPVESMVCRVCLTALDWFEPDEGPGEWVHALAQLVTVPGVAGHDPVPVPAASMLEHRYKCDFCFAPDPVWIFPAKTFDMPDMDYGSAGDWGACDACHDVIVTGDLNKLVYRVVRTNPNLSAFKGRQREYMTTMMTMWLREFMTHRDGEPYRKDK